MRIRTRGWISALLLPLAAACDDGGTSGPAPITAAEVAGVYSVCQLTFVPEGGLSSVSIPGQAFETQASGVQAPILRVDPARQIELAYTPKGLVVSQNVRGQFDLDGNSVTLRFNDSGTAQRGALLLPDRLQVSFQPSPMSLTASNSDVYTVPRADYARLSGQSETNLAAEIRGRLTASFRAGGCS